MQKYVSAYILLNSVFHVRLIHMNERFSLSQYRAIDIFFFTFIIAGAEFLTGLATTRWFPEQLYTASAAAGIAAIVMARWKWAAAVPLIADALILYLIYGSAYIQLAVYAVGNLTGLLGILVLKAFLKGEKRLSNPLSAMAYGLATALLMQTGRAVVTIICGYGLKNAVGLYATDSLSLLFTAVIMFVACRQDGLLEDQKHYILRIKEEDKQKDLYGSEG